MATRRWLGTATAVADVKTVQITAYDAATTYKLTVNNKDVSVAGTTDAAGTATALAAAWNASTEPEFAEVTASANSDTVTLTHDTKGVPFTASASVSGGTGTIGAVTTTTSGTGPNDWSNADNWSGNAVPVDADDVVIDVGPVAIKYGLDQSSIQPASLTIGAGYTGTIGLPEENGSGASRYYEYRETYLKIGPTTVTIGSGTGNGSGRIKLNTGTDQTTINVLGTGTPASLSGGATEPAAVTWKGAHASNALNVLKGSVAVAYYGGETATVATLRVGHLDNPAGDAAVRLGAGVTLTDVDVSGGTVEINSATTTLQMTDGTVSVLAGAHASIEVDGGTLYYRSTGTLTTLRVGDGGTADFSRDMRARTVTNCELHKGSTFRDPYKTVTPTNGFDFYRCRVEDVAFDAGTHLTLTPSAI